MTPFEEEVKKALDRCEPPEGFTERLAARIAALPAARKRGVNTSWSWAAAAAAMMLLVGGAAVEKRYEQARKGEMAKQQVLLAMRITNAKLQQAQERIRQVEREGMQ